MTHMKKITTVLVMMVLIIGGYVFIQDRKNKGELSKVEESMEVISTSTASTVTPASEIILTRSNGAWSVTSTGEYTIDPLSLTFEFTGYKPGGQHIGVFNTMSASIALDDSGNPILSKITIDPTSVKTNTEAVDKHLQAPEFFDTSKFPEVIVVVKEIQNDNLSIKAITDITIKGITKTLAIPVTVIEVSDEIKFDVDTRIKISEFEMAYGPVQDEVRVTLSGVLKKINK